MLKIWYTVAQFSVIGPKWLHVYVPQGVHNLVYQVC